MYKIPTPLFFLAQLLIILTPLFSCAQGNGPVGWAGLNGGTTGGAGGDTVTVSNRSQFVNVISSDMPLVVQVEDTIELILYERVDVGSNKTITGLGYNATLLYGGLEIEGDNVIVRNLRITGSYDGDWDGKTHSTDAITVYGQNVWIDHCDLSAGADGLLDITSNGSAIADYVTVSWTRFSNHNKVSLIGSSDNNTRDRNHLNTTFHHCWFDGFPGRGVNQRMPRVRFADIHVFNTFFDDVDSYCIAARIESDVVVEYNYFRNSSDPLIIDDQGLGIEDPDLVATGNIYEFSTGSKSTHGSAFDPASHYDYVPDDPATLPPTIMNGAGLFNDPGNRPPQANADTIRWQEGSSRLIEIDAAANDVDADGGDLRISTILNAESLTGIARILDNRITYVASSDPSGVDTVLYQLVDTQGGVDTGMVLVFFEETTGIFDLSVDNTPLSIFPNPANQQARIEYTAAGKGEIQTLVYDLLGRRHPDVISKRSAGVKGELQQFTLHTRSLNSGVYILLVQEGERFFSKRFSVLK